VPPDGCLYKPEDIDHPTAVWQLNDELNERFMLHTIRALQHYKLKWKGGNLIELLMTEGHRRHKWPLPRGHHDPMPTIDHSRLSSQ